MLANSKSKEERLVASHQRVAAKDCRCHCKEASSAPMPVAVVRYRRADPRPTASLNPSGRPSCGSNGAHATPIFRCLVQNSPARSAGRLACPKSPGQLRRAVRNALQETPILIDASTHVGAPNAVRPGGSSRRVHVSPRARGRRRASGMRHASFLGMLLPCRALRKNHHVPVWSGGSPVSPAFFCLPF